MTDRELADLAMLPSTLRMAANRIDRAVALLRAAGDLAALEKKLQRACGLERPATSPGAEAAAPGALRGEASQGMHVRVQPHEAGVAAIQNVAVFGGSKGASQKKGEKSTGGAKTPF